MAKTAKNILTLNHEEAMDFSMKSEQYHGFEQPEHFTFDEVQKYVREKIGDAPHKGGVQEASLYTLHINLLVAGKNAKPLRNNEWLRPEQGTNILYDSVVDTETLKKVTPVITFKEIRKCNELNNN